MECATLQEIRGRLIQRIKRTPTVESFRFILEKRMPFVAGQFLQVIFDEKNRANAELNKYLSFSSSPQREYIEVTKRLSGSLFSKRLEGLKAKDEVLFKGPLGKCVPKQEHKHIGFLIGGIGITPVISIIENIIDNRFDIDVELFYSNRSEEEIAFKEELISWQEKSKNLRVIYTVTDCPSEDKKCIYGRIDKNLFINMATALDQRVFFIFGPSKMTEAMKRVCLEAGCREENVNMENFVGY